MTDKEYYVGFDIGTDSVGMAVTDTGDICEAMALIIAPMTTMPTIKITAMTNPLALFFSS